jgi:hypothetical protein
MAIPHIVALSLSAVVIVAAAEGNPPRPTPEQVAKVLGIDEKRVSADEKPQNSRLDGKVLWLASYKISGKQDCGLSITLFPKNRIKTDFIEKIGANQNEFRKITKDDGDVIYHSLGDRGDQGTFYMTTLINHEADWDMTLILARDSGVAEINLPFSIARDGIKLIGDFEALLRKQEAEQAGADQPATKPADKPPVRGETSTPTSKDGPR